MREKSFDLYTHDSQPPKSRGGEKKVMKKSLSLLLAFALVFSMFSSLALANEDLTLEQQYEAQKAKGYYSGINEAGDPGFDLPMNRAQFARVAALILGLEGIGNPDTKVVTEKPFDDVELDKWYAEEVAAVKEAGLFVGDGTGKFNPEDELTIEQLAVVLVGLLGLDPVEGAEVEGATYGAPYIQALIDNGISFPTNYKEAALRADLVRATYVADQVLNPESATGFGAKAIGARKIEVTFDGAVDTSKVKISVLNKQTPVNIKEITFADNKKSAVIEFTNDLISAKYTVKVEGIADEAQTVEVDFEASKVVKIEFPNDKLVMDRDNKKIARISFKVYNQYNEDVTENTSVNVTNSREAVTKSVSNGVAEVVNASDLTIGDKIHVTALHQDTNTFASVTAEVATPARIASLELVELVAKDDKELQVGEGVGNLGDRTFKIRVIAKDQYGNEVTSVTHWTYDVAVSPAGTGGTIELQDPVQVDDNKIYLPISKINNAGDVTVSAVALTTGNRAVMELKVKEAVKVDTLTLQAPQFAPKGEEVEIPYTAVDQFGNTVKHPDFDLQVSGAGTGGKAEFVKNVVKDETKLVLTLGDNANDTVIISGVTPGGKFSTLTVTTVEKAKPFVVAGVKDASALFIQDSVTIDKDKIVIKDQYNRDINLDDVVDNAKHNYTVKIERTSGDKVTVDGGTSSTLTDADRNAALVAAASKGSATFKVTLIDDKNKEVKNSALTFTVRVVDKEDIESYEASVDGVIFAADTNANGIGKELSVKGILKDGTKVNIPRETGGNANWTVDELNDHVTFNPADNKIYVYDDAAVAKDGFFGDGTGKDGDHTIVVTVFGHSAPDIKAVPIKVSNKDRVAASFELVKDGVVVTEVLDGNAVVVKEANKANAAQIAYHALKTVDQYGQELGTAGNTYESDNFNIYTSNATDGKALADLQPGDSYTITVVDKASGKNIAFKVLIDKN